MTGGADVDGDGYGDLLVVNARAPSSQTSIYQGSSTGLPTAPSQSLLASGITAFGVSGSQGLQAIAVLGDLNGDGLSDFVVSWGGTNGKAGGAAVYSGSGAIAQVPPFTAASGSFFW